METGSPTSSAFTNPLVVLLLVTLGSSLGFKLLSHKHPSFEPKSAENGAGESASSRSGESGPRGGSTVISAMSNEELAQFSKQTILERFEVNEVTIEEAIAALESGVLKAASNQKRPIIALSPEWQDSRTRVMAADQTRIHKLSLREIPLEVTIKFVCDSTQTGFRYEAGKILITPSRWNSPNQKLCACGSPLDEHGEHLLNDDFSPIESEVLPPINE